MVLICTAKGQNGQLSLSHERSLTSRGLFQNGEPSGFWGRFELAFDRRADEVFAAELHPLKLMNWSLKRPDDSWTWVLDRNDRSVESALAKSVEYSLRDAAIGLPLMGWLETRRDALRDLFVDSVNAVEEETVSPLDPSYRPIERLWWQNLAANRFFRFGLRPFRNNPYGFLSLRIKDDDRLLLLGHLRYYYEKFADHRFELAVSAPLPFGFALDVGTAYQFGRHDEVKQLVLKLSKPLRHGGIVHLALEAQHKPTLLAGISVPW